MDPRVGPLYEIFKINTRFFMNAIDGMDSDQAAWRQSESTNSTGFIALHLVQSRHFIARTLGLELDDPFAPLTKGRRSIAEMQGMPALDELRNEWKRVTGEIRQRMGEIGAADLDRDTGTKLPVDDKSVLGVLAFFMHHEAYHIGQVAILRKQCGLPAMSLK